MDIKGLKKSLTSDNIKFLAAELGGYFFYEDEQKIIFNTFCHGGDSNKLYYYKESQIFNCYTHCGTFDVVELVQKVLGVTFFESLIYISNLFNFESVEFTNNNVDDDWAILNKYKKIETEKVKRAEVNIFKKDYLNKYYKYYHKSFIEDGISIRTLKKFEVYFDILNRRIIIPHFNKDGELVAIRCRNLDEDLVNEGKKYMPINIDGVNIASPTHAYFYGSFQNKDAIKRAKTVILVEAEKGVMQLEDILIENISLALMGSSIGEQQIEFLSELGVETVIIALDKEYSQYGSLQEKKYAMKIRKALIVKLKRYFNVEVIWDKEKNLLKEKDSPTDHGSEIFFELFEGRIKIL